MWTVFSFHVSRIRYTIIARKFGKGKVWWIVCDLPNQTFKVVLTYNNLFADLFICQTFFAKHLEKVNLPNVFTTTLSAIRYTNWMENLLLEYKWGSSHYTLLVLVKFYHLLGSKLGNYLPLVIYVYYLITLTSFHLLYPVRYWDIIFVCCLIPVVYLLRLTECPSS